MVNTIQPFFARGEISPALYGRVDTSAYQAGLRTARNALVRVGGGIMNRPGTIYLGPVKHHDKITRLIPFEFKTTDTHILEFGDGYVRIIREDFHVLESSFNITGVTQASPGVVTTGSAHGYSEDDEVEINSVEGMVPLNGQRFRVGNPTSTTFELKHQRTGDPVDTSAYPAYTSGGIVAKIFEVASPYSSTDLPTLKYTQSADVMTLTHPNYPIHELKRFAIDNWTLEEATLEPQATSPTGVNVTANNSGSETYTYQVTAIDETTEEESFPDEASVSSAAAIDDTDPLNNTITWDSQSGVLRFVIYREKNGIFGFIGEAEGTSFVDDNIEPDISDTPPRERNPFDTAGFYPSTTTLFEQRRMFGGGIEEPDTWHASRTGAFNNFTKSFPTQADDAITATLASRQVNEIRHMVPTRDLIMFTSGSEWSVSSQGEASFSADTVSQRPQSNWGSSHRRPITVGNTILFVQEDNSTVRSIGYRFDVDGYESSDLSLLSSHLFEYDNITDWSISRAPDQHVVITKSDGEVAVLTFNEEQNVIAWTRWDTQGDFLTTAGTRPCLETPEYATYFTVRRTIDGESVQYIERTAKRRVQDVREGFFVDAGISYNNPSSISGVDHENDDRIRITLEGHGLSEGQLIEINDIIWEDTEFGDKGGNPDIDQLNGNQYVVEDPTTDTFFLVDPTTSQRIRASSDFVPRRRGGTVRTCISSVFNLDHIEGKGVSVIADGVVYSDVVVEDGQISLDKPAARVYIGIPFVSEVETLNIEGSSRSDSTFQGLMKRVNKLTIRFDDSREVLVGPNRDQLTPMKPYPYRDSSIQLFSGDREIIIPPSWNTNGKILIRHIDPTPMSVLAIVPEFEVED